MAEKKNVVVVGGGYGGTLVARALSEKLDSARFNLVLINDRPFYVHLPASPSEKPKLSCLMYQRSADLGLGIPFNIASYALLTHMIAHVTDTEPHELIIQLGDAHVYRDHVEALNVQLQRQPRPFPTFHFKRTVEDIDGFEADDFIVEGYNPYPTIAMKMSV